MNIKFASAALLLSLAVTLGACSKTEEVTPGTDAAPAEVNETTEGATDATKDEATEAVTDETKDEASEAVTDETKDKATEAVTDETKPEAAEEAPEAEAEAQ